MQPSSCTPADLRLKPDLVSDTDTQVYQALNALGAVPWQINRDILGVVEQLYEDETGYKHLKIPAKESLDMPLPTLPPHSFRTDRTKNGGLIARVSVVLNSCSQRMYVMQPEPATGIHQEVLCGVNSAVHAASREMCHHSPRGSVNSDGVYALRVSAAGEGDSMRCGQPSLTLLVLMYASSSCIGVVHVLTSTMLPPQYMKPHRRVMYLFNRQETSARKHNAEAHSLRADLEWKLQVRP